MATGFFAWVHRNQAPDEPCVHIKPHLNSLADGSMPESLLRRFIRFHLIDCSYCQNALFNLLALRLRLYDLKPAQERNEETLTLDPERRAAMESAWDAVDKAS